MTTKAELTPEELEHQYNARAAIPEHTEILAGWTARTADWQAASDCRLDLSYGSGARERLDLYLARHRHGPLEIFIHGGYWQRGDKSGFGFVAESFVEEGINVAVLNYALCPSVRIGDIAPRIAHAVVWLWRHADDFGYDRERLHVCGHSAGGHLAAMMLTSDWPALGEGLPIDLIKSALPVSGLYELEPLCHTSLNGALRMDSKEARDASPASMKPKYAAPVIAAVGGAESPEFHRQADLLSAAWRQHGLAAAPLEVPKRNHFRMLDSLADKDSVVHAAALRLLDARTPP